MPRRANSLLNLSQAFQRYCEAKLPELKKRNSNKDEGQLLSQVKRVWENMRIEEKSKWDQKSQDLMISPVKTGRKRKVQESTGTKSVTQSNNKQSHSNQQQTIKSETSKGHRKISKKLFQDKTKKIAKQIKKESTVQQYRSFYKFQYNKLQQDHPNWNSSKITTVVSLLWKKVKQSLRNKTQQEVEAYCERIISGKQAFKEAKMQEGNHDQNIEEMWQRLPVQAKRKWEHEGTGLTLGRAKKEPVRVKLTCQATTKTDNNPLEFMRNRMP